MNSVSLIIDDYIKNVTDLNDRRLINESLNLLNSADTINDTELDILNEIFFKLKEDYTISIIQDEINLQFMIAITKQEEPVIEPKHDINILVNELRRFSFNNNLTKLENVALNFLDAGEHIEEDEVLLIQNIIRYLNNNWELRPFEERKYNGETIKYSRIIPGYNKKLVKKS